MNLKIETERLILRPFTIDDVEDLYQMNLDPKVSKYTMDGGIHTKEEIREILTKSTLTDYKKHGFGRLAVFYKDNMEFLGFSGLKYLEDMDDVDIGYRYKSTYWGKGIATEAARPFLDYGFKELKLQKIIGMVHPDNPASSNVLKKLGFSFEKNIMEEGVEIELYGIKSPVRD